ncbi:TonB-dependent siderophore receptor [Paraglaciecola sp. L1A13]|uniref:TonB-dependent receptor plug domain-containing protein n=1 Tax=Paraglaciecola sp. L1A13 TaxID=2686359 RepID=UPI00131CBBDD|nr:TonB-dependent receptor [Paraglaciecola sp. L1A13]
MLQADKYLSEKGFRLSKVGILRKVIVLSIAAGAASHANAQSESEVSDPAMEKIVVTGTSIARDDSEALPVTVMSQEEMDLRDAGTPVELLTSLPSVTGVPLNESTQGGAGARGDVAGIAMRGLGTEATLVLLNGRRIAAHGMAQGTTMTVNANTMPARGLQRVDVLRDGASSIYGSDAVAGVVNFVIDSKYEGTKLEVQGGFNEIGSGDNRRFTATHGGYYMSDKLHVTTTLDVYDRDPIYMTDIGGDADKVSRVPYGFNSVNGPFFDRNASSQYPIFSVDGLGTRYMVPTGEGSAIISDTPGARDGEFSRDAYYDMNSGGYSLPETSRLNWFTQLDYELDNGVQLFGEALYYAAESNMERAPVAYSASANRTIVIDADNPINPYDANVTLSNYRFVDNGNERAEVDTEAFRGVLGARGDISANWDWETAATYSRNRTRDISQNAIRESAAIAAIDAGLYNPFGYNFDTIDGVVTPTSGYVNDPDVIDTFSQKFRQTGTDILATADARVTGELVETWAGALQVAFGVEYRYEDYLLHRPQYAGLNYEGNELGLDPDDNDFIQASPAANLSGTRGVFAGFGEAVIPLASPYNDIPGIYSLSIGASLRYENYDDFGSTTNPKFTIDYRPVEAIMIRSSYNEGFRAPNLAMLGYERTTVASYNDPYRADLIGGGESPRLQTTGALGELEPETSEGITLGVVVNIPWASGLSLSVDYFKIEMENVIATPNASQIRNDDAARLQTATQAALDAGTSIDNINLGSGTDSYVGNPNVVRAAVTDEDRAVFADFNASRPQSQWLAAAGQLINTLTSFANLDNQEVAGYDFNVTYKMPDFSWGTLSFVTDWTYLDEFTRTGGLTGVSEEILATDGNAELRGSMSLSWENDTWAAGVSGYYIGEYADTAATFNPDETWNGSLPGYVKTVDGVNYWKVEQNITFNAFVSKTFYVDDSFLDGTSIRLGVKNLLDEEPPLTPDYAGYDPSVYNSVAMGRVWTLRLTKDF